MIKLISGGKMNTENQQENELPQGCELAMASEAFYLTNMILAPGLGFIMLVFLYMHCQTRHASAFALNHLRQTMAATFITGVIAVGFMAAIYFTGGIGSPWFWHLLTGYFVLFHAPLSWFGIVGFSKALSGEEYRYPFVGVKLLKDAQPAMA
jgi:uncharacterized membrane protein